MKICYVTDERFPSTGTDTQQVVMTINALCAAGADVTMVCPEMTQGEHAGKQHDNMGNYYGVTRAFDVQLVRTVDPSQRGWVKSLHGFSALSAVRQCKPDLVYTRNVQLAAIFLSAGYKVAFESYRIVDRKWPTVARFFGWMSRRKRFLGVINHSNVSSSSFIRSGVPESKLRVIYNGFSSEHMEPPLDTEVARGRCELPAKELLAIYTGHINPGKGINELARLAKGTPDVRHVWVGGAASGATDYAKECCAEHQLTNVLTPGWVSPKVLANYLFSADVLLIPPSTTPLKQHGSTVLPMKTYAYLAAGRAILAPDLADLREILHHGENAWLIEPDSDEAAQKALLHLSQDAALRQRLGAAALESSKKYTWAARGKKILAFLEEQLSA